MNEAQTSTSNKSFYITCLQFKDFGKKILKDTNIQISNKYSKMSASKKLRIYNSADTALEHLPKERQVYQQVVY